MLIWQSKNACLAISEFIHDTAPMLNTEKIWRVLSLHSILRYFEDKMSKDFVEVSRN